MPPSTNEPRKHTLTDKQIEEWILEGKIIEYWDRVQAGDETLLEGAPIQGQVVSWDDIFKVSDRIVGKDTDEGVVHKAIVSKPEGDRQSSELEIQQFVTNQLPPLKYTSNRVERQLTVEVSAIEDRKETVLHHLLSLVRKS